MTTSPEGVIAVEPGRRGGRPTIRGSRIAVGDVLGWLAAGMSVGEIVADYPELTEADVRAALAYAADRERGTASTEEDQAQDTTPRAVGTSPSSPRELGAAIQARFAPLGGVDLWDRVPPREAGRIIPTFD